MRSLYPSTILFILAILALSTCISGFVLNNNRNNAAKVKVSSLQAKQEATFGMGCFWKPSEELLKVDGVLETAAGYTGNPSAREVPNYDKVCFSRDWVEGVRVVYDDDKITYQQLLDAFFETQEPKIGGSRQYASIIFPHDDLQKETAAKWLQEGVQSNRVRASDGVPLSVTQLEPVSPFYRAEGYHQNYWQKFRPRVGGVVSLIIVSMIHWDPYVTPDVASTIDTAADWGLKAIALSVILERVLDTQVVELK